MAKLKKKTKNPVNKNMAADYKKLKQMRLKTTNVLDDLNTTYKTTVADVVKTVNTYYSAMVIKRNTLDNVSGNTKPITLNSLVQRLLQHTEAVTEVIRHEHYDINSLSLDMLDIVYGKYILYLGKVVELSTMVNTIKQRMIVQSYPWTSAIANTWHDNVTDINTKPIRVKLSYSFIDEPFEFVAMSKFAIVNLFGLTKRELKEAILDGDIFTEATVDELKTQLDLSVVKLTKFTQDVRKETL